MQKHILLIGGAGFVGSHVNHMLCKAGYNTIVLDNLSRGHRNAVIHGTFIEGNMADTALLDRVFTQYSISAVMHFAALTSIGESVIAPLEYYKNNVANTLCLLEVMHKHRINVFVFSSSAAIFGLPEESKITESHRCLPINPYGQSKLMVETILRDHDQAYGIRSCCLRYFNAAGGDPGEMIKYYIRPETNIIPRVLNSLKYHDAEITINGNDYPTPDGTCVRDYVHIEDIGSAHITAMQRLIEGAPSSCYNLGNGNGFSVREVVAAAEKVTSRRIKIIEGERRPGDPPVLVADAQKAKKELHWEPRYESLESMILHAWQAR